MILLTHQLHRALRANACLRLAALRHERPEPSNESRGSFDPVPVLKLFNPIGAATWLASELDADGDTLFGLADLGFGCPELGSFSLSEIADLRLPLGLRIERDIGFSTAHALSAWADCARRAGSIAQAERLLCRAPSNQLPPRGG